MKIAESRELKNIVDVAKTIYEKTWRASDDLLEALPHILDEFQPKRILEFGPGISSLILQFYLQHVPQGIYVGIDDENPWAREHQSRLSSFKFNPKYTHICQLNSLDSWYDLPTMLLTAFAPFDMIVVDGPGDDAARICHRALDLYKTAANYRTIWIVDDSSRPASGWLVGKWLPNWLQTYTATNIYDRNYNRITTVIIPAYNKEGR